MKNKSDYNPLVSIIINCYNGEAHLQDCIESLLLQTYKNWEIVFWDNQSNDKSKKIAQSYGPKVKYYYAENHTNLGKARALASEKAKGQYLSFLDADDLWDPTKLEKQINTFLRLNSETVINQLAEKFPDLGENPSERDVFLKLRELRNSW